MACLDAAAEAFRRFADCQNPIGRRILDVSVPEELYLGQVASLTLDLFNRLEYVQQAVDGRAIRHQKTWTASASIRRRRRG